MTAQVTLAEPTPVKLRIEDYLQLSDAGALQRYAKTELIGGVIVAMNAQYSAHARAKSRLFRRLADAVDAMMPGFEAWSEVSVAIPPSDLPEPDIVVTRFQGGREPVPVATVALIVEVADTTLEYDLGTKAALYAGAGVAEYWVVDLQGGKIHQLWAPEGEEYTRQAEVAFGALVKAETIDGVEVATDGVR